MRPVFYAQSNFSQLSKEQQSLLFALKIVPKFIQTDHEGKKFYYYHINHNTDKDLNRVEMILTKLKIKHSKVNTITNINTKYTSIYLIYIPKYIVRYLDRGPALNIFNESVYIVDLFNNAAIL